MDPAFEGCGQEAGIQIWRVEQMEVKPLDPKDYGTFYSGDSYILLHTDKLKSGKLNWNIHFWLGKDTSQDEAGVAAIKSVELDDVLGGTPVQHREVQAHESEQFLSYFKKGIRCLEGGVASGFHHVEDEVVKRLLQVKGRRNVRVHQVPLSAQAMNQGDCFILDAGPNLYVWVGANSGRLERLKAIQAASGIRDDVHAGRSKIQIIDESSSSGERHEFFSDLGSDESDVRDSDSGGDDAQYERSNDTEISLHQISDDDGKLQVDRIAEKPLKQEFLDSGNCYLLDGGSGGLFVWVGKGASSKERSESMKLAEKYLDYRGYPKWRPVSRVIDGGETPLFKQYFSTWHDPEDQVGLGRVYTEEQIASLPEEFNVAVLHSDKRRLLAKSAGKAVGFMPDDGSGQIEIWRVENFELSPVDPGTYGMFFGGDSYVIKYTYDSERGQRYVLYFWQGVASSQDEKAASAIWAVRMDNELFGKAVQVRVAQGEEPEHFLRMFRGKMVIFLGGHASGFKNIHDHDTYDVDGTRMFHIKGTSQVNTRAIQVPEVAGSLCSDDVFVLETPSETFFWIGKSSSEEEREFGQSLAGLVSPGRDAVPLNEGEETDAFWQSIGGRGPYLESRGAGLKPHLAARLFKCSLSTGRIRVEEIRSFDQDDLSEDDVMILDTGDEVFVWIGSGASEDEKGLSLKLAEDYIRTDPTDRTVDTSVIITVKQNEEPLAFTSIFKSWNQDLWKNKKSYEDLKSETLG